MNKFTHIVEKVVPDMRVVVLLLLFLMVSHGRAQQIDASPETWNLHDPAFHPEATVGCTVRIENGKLIGQAVKGSSAVYVILPRIHLEAPVDLVMRVRTSQELYGRGEIYWTTTAQPDWSMQRFVRFPVHHDGEWHDYIIHLPATGQVTQIRLCVGWTEGLFEIDKLRLVRDSSRPVADLPERLHLESDLLSVDFEPRIHRYSIQDKRTRRIWFLEGRHTKATLTKTSQDDVKNFTLNFWDSFSQTDFSCKVTLPEGDQLAFEISNASLEVPFYGLNTYPPMPQSDIEGGRLLFCDRSCGVYANQRDEIYGGRLLQVYGNTSCTDMPWIGVVDPLKGDGVMALVETPWDALFHLQADPQGRHWPQIQWEESMMALHYPRRLSYRFSPEGGYVALAQMYREYARETGKLVTLEEKARRNPNVNLLKGAAVVWGALDAKDFIHRARTLGFMHGVLSNAHHGLRDKSSLRVLNAAGYLTNEYDNVTDILDGPTGQQSDSVRDAALHPLPGHGPMGGWVDAAHAYTIRSSAFALRAMKSYVPKALEEYGFNGRFLDVLMAIGLNEDYHPEHTFDHRQDLANRRGVFEWLNSQGLVVGTEHGNDWGIDLVDYTEGSLSGPFWWLHDNPQGWHLVRFTKPKPGEQYHQEYLRFGHDYGNRIPLWQLVYHDCAMSSWYWLDTPGVHYGADPEITDRKDLFTLLYGGVPLMWRDQTDYGWPQESQRFMRTYHDTCPFQEELAFSQMVSHEFLSEDMALQRTRFSSGHSVVVNFSPDPREYLTDSGETITLAPKGFWASGPGVRQSRLMRDGEVVTEIEKDGYARYESPSLRRMGPFELRGDLVAFRTGCDRWQMALGTGTTCQVDLKQLTGWDEPVKIESLDEFGDTRRVIGVVPVDQSVSLDTASDTPFFALSPWTGESDPVIYPFGPYISAASEVLLSTPAGEAEIRYTLDGSDPSLSSLIYSHPFYLVRSCTVTARSFSRGIPAGTTVKRPFFVTRVLFKSGILHGGDSPAWVDVDLQGTSQLRLLIGNGGDSCWNDWADIGDDVLTGKDGSRVQLSSLKPVKASQTYEHLGFDRNSRDGAPLCMAGRVCEHGLSTYSEGEILFDLHGQYSHFEAWVGIDDRVDPKGIHTGSVQFTIEGVLPEN